MKKPYKRLSKNVITFDSGDDNRVVVLAKLGMSNKAIRDRTKLTSNQITYRLHKAKVVEENDGGYRVEFRNGVSPLAQQLINDLSGVLEQEVRRNISPRILHLVPETVK
jgi:hypothetical protein